MINVAMKKYIPNSIINTLKTGGEIAAAINAEKDIINVTKKTIIELSTAFKKFFKFFIFRYLF